MVKDKSVGELRLEGEGLSCEQEREPQPCAQREIQLVIAFEGAAALGENMGEFRPEARPQVKVQGQEGRQRILRVHPRAQVCGRKIRPVAQRVLVQQVRADGNARVARHLIREEGQGG